ncbi:ABC transporter permease [Myceligenerans salitolerans]|uniref:Transport permease protein n=1 Tax=Myceligenerans salitolerans TaxID=1230528 RepID=A0ABS3IDN8_9MICO|nr:ABC transporter permease [Myceligenerans salitolerans]MBO0611045.1 ABC transporter permease [Myceligenerans salitolerans]
MNAGPLLTTETKVWLRDPAAVFFALVFPVLLLVGLGLVIPDFRSPMEEPGLPWDSAPNVTIWLPTILALAVATISLTTMPVQFATFREKGVLRRLATTPMPPRNLIGAHLVINVVALLVAAAAAVVGGMTVLDIPFAVDPLVVLLCFVLATTAMFSLGLLVAARADRGSAASGIGMLIYFPSLLFSGVWVPIPVMPDWMAQMAKYTPIGAASQGMLAGWFGDDFPLTQVLVMVAWTAVLFPLGIKLFRWT